MMRGPVVPDHDQFPVVLLPQGLQEGDARLGRSWPFDLRRAHLTRLQTDGAVVADVVPLAWAGGPDQGIVAAPHPQPAQITIRAEVRLIDEEDAGTAGR